MKTFFVSSTFRDMQFERDAIAEIALPKISAVAKRYGETVSFCDLRWGIDTSDLDNDAGSRKVLDVCFDQIDRSSSPMIVILGERYGYIPARGIIEQAAQQKRLRLADLEMSVTALEIEYGVFSEFAKRNALFYFREIDNAPDEYLSEDAAHAEKLNALKARIHKLTGGKCRTYKVAYRDGKIDGVEKFADMLAEDLCAMLEPQWKEQAGLTPFERERKTQENFIDDRVSVFRGREDIINELISRVDGGQSLVVVKGGAGSGKSGIFSKLTVELRERGYDVLPFIGGLTSESNDALDIIRNTVVYLENKLGKPHWALSMSQDERGHKASEWRARANELIAEYCAAGHRFIVAVDAVDKLYDDEYRHSLAFIPDVNIDGFCFIATCIDTFKELKSGCVMLDKLGTDDRRAVIEGTLARYGRELDAGVVSEMLELPDAGNPLYLGFLIRRLIMMNRDDYAEINRSGGKMTDISERQRRILRLCPSSVDEMCATLLDEASKRINERLISEVLRLIACSRYGLRESDLRSITGSEWNVLDFLHFVSYMDNCFILRDDGRYDFSHSGIRDGILKTTDGLDEHRKIIECLKAAADEITDEELLYHMIKADDKPLFRPYVVRMVQRYIGDAHRTDLVAFAKNVLAQAATDGGAWLAAAISFAPPDEESMAFAVSMLAIESYCASNFVYLDAGVNICTAVKALAERMIAAGKSCGEELLQMSSVQLGLLQMVTGDIDNSMTATREFYEKAKRDFDATGDHAAFNELMQALRIYIIAATQSAFTDTDDDSGEKELERVRVNEYIDEAVAIAEARHADPSPTSALELGFAYVIKALGELYDDDMAGSAEHVARAVSMFEPYVDGFDDESFRQVQEILNAVGMLVMKYLEATLNPDMIEATAGNCVTLDESRSVDEFTFETRKHAEKCAETIYSFSIGLCETAYARLGQSEWLTNACMAYVNYATLSIHRCEFDAGTELLEKALSVIAETEKREFSVATRAMSAKAKTMLATCYLMSGMRIAEAKSLILSASVDADNIIASDDGMIGRNAAVEAYIGLINLYTNGGFIDFEDAYAAFEKLVAAGKNDAYVEGLIASVAHIYYIQMAVGLTERDRNVEALEVARVGIKYAQSRYELSPVDTLDILYMYDELIYNLLVYELGLDDDTDPVDRYDELENIVLEATSLIENKLSLAVDGTVTIAPVDIEEVMDTYGDYLDTAFELFDEDESLMHDIIEAAVEAYNDAYRLTNDTDYLQHALSLQNRK